MHQAAHDYVRDALDAVTWPKGTPRIIEVGSRDVNGTIRDLLPADAAYTGLDLTEGANVDEVADATTWTPKRKADLVLCLEVLEHAPDWQAIVTAAAGWLKRKGRLVLTAACDPRAPHSAVDGGPIRPGEHYANVEPDELRDVLEPLGNVDMVVDLVDGDVRATLTVR
jgi:hypothetical protein